MSPEPAADTVALLRGHGVQVTAQRLAVLRAVAAQPHATADDVVERARAELGAISRQAVYDALVTLTGKGILRRVQPPGSVARFEPRSGTEHHHVICRSCRRMTDVACTSGHADCLDVARESGFQVDEAEVLYWGRCPECLAAAAPQIVS